MLEDSCQLLVSLGSHRGLTPVLGPVEIVKPQWPRAGRPSWDILINKSLPKKKGYKGRSESRAGSGCSDPRQSCLGNFWRACTASQPDFRVITEQAPLSLLLGIIWYVRVCG